ncbi:MAG: class I SAM-dependent methyltransferase [Cyanobacteria bacterium P01_D01_bin.73]
MPSPSSKSAAPSCSVLVTDPKLLDRSLVAGAIGWERQQGSWVVLCVPSLVPVYVERAQRLAYAFGHPFTAEEMPRVQEMFREKVKAGFSASPYSRLVVRYGTAPPPERGLVWQLETFVVSPQEQAEQFVVNRPPEQFEAFPDAMVMAVADAVSTDAAAPSLDILDIGGGTGRNGLALAAAGHQVTVLDSNAVMLRALGDRLAERSEKSQVTVIEGSVLDERVVFPSNGFDLVILTGVLPYFSSLEELQQVFQQVAIALKPGGQVLLDAFVTTDDYQPTGLAREMGRISDAMMFQPSTLDEAIAGTGLGLVGEDDAWAYEMENLEPEAKEARQWLESWAMAKRIFALPKGQRPPVVLKWLRYSKQS